MIPGLLLWLSLCPPADRPLVSEVFYDASGADTDREFVELYNPTAHTWPLADLRLEAGNGSERGDWTLRWTGGAADSLPPGARFLIGGDQVEPLPHAVARLSLQNGPDAIRLVWQDGATETIGYGVHEFDEFFCGESAVDVAPGQSLARIPDDRTSGDNATDFRASTPSPGRANQPQRDIAWVAGSLTLSPVQPDVGAPARFEGLAWNPGRETVASGALHVRVETRLEAGVLEVARAAVDSVIAFGDTARIEVECRLPAGKQVVIAWLDRDADEVAVNDRDSLRVRVGAGPLEITEIQFHPRSGEGEWIEVRNRTDQALDLAAFTLSDRGAARARIEGPAWCSPGSLAVLAQQPLALVTHYPAIDAARVWPVAGWPALNNSDDPTGVADAVVLRELDGTPVARHDYGAAGVPDGVPIEPREGFWWPSLDPAGSPLALPRAARASRPFELGPRRVRDGRAAVRLAWSLPWPRASLAFDLYDLAGGWVGRLRGDQTVPGRGEIEHRLSGLEAGLYVVVMRARDERGREALVSSQALRVGGAAR